MKANRWNIYFLSSLFLNLLVIEFSFPSLVRGELFAEIATNFLYHARYSSFFENLFKPDFGYIPLVPRLISLFAHHLFPDYWFPFLVNQTAFFLIAVANASLNLKWFEGVFRSRWLTWFLSIFYCFHFDYEQFVLMNLSYAFVPLFLLVFLSETPVVFFLVVAMIFLSKAAYLAFFPAILFLVWHHRRLKGRVALCLGALMIQVVSIFLHRHDVVPVEKHAFGESLVIIVRYLILVATQTVFPSVSTGTFLNYFPYVVTILAFAYFFYRLPKEKYPAVAFLVLVMGGAAFLFERSFGITFSTAFSWCRAHLMVRFACFFLALYLVASTVANQRLKGALLTYLFIFNFTDLVGRTAPLGRDPYRAAIHSHSNWKRDYPITLRESFCIPINPKGWSFCHGKISAE